MNSAAPDGSPDLTLSKPADHKDFYLALLDRLKEDFPQTSSLLQEGLLQVEWERVTSPFFVEISQESHRKIIQAVKSLYDHSRRFLGDTTVTNHSVLMSYDFHTSDEGDAKLIEINTNASGYLMSCLLLATHRFTSVFHLQEMENLKSSFMEELKSGLGKTSDSVRVAIIDDNVASQKMLIEFYLYKEAFEHWGWSAEICEAGDLKIKEGRVYSPNGFPVDFIYNRTTDFFLQEERHEALRAAWENKWAVVSPQPREYQALADKRRLLELQKEKSDLPPTIQNVLLSSFDKGDFKDGEDLWSQRKNFFFKPKNSFGGKAAYRGKSIGRSAFNRLLNEDPLIQEHFPPQKSGDWKFDVRCFAYQDQVQLLCGRLYKGQLTNFFTPFGGFCPVRLKS